MSDWRLGIQGGVGRGVGIKSVILCQDRADAWKLRSVCVSAWRWDDGWWAWADSLVGNRHRIRHFGIASKTHRLCSQTQLVDIRPLPLISCVTAGKTIDNSEMPCLWANNGKNDEAPFKVLVWGLHEIMHIELSSRLARRECQTNVNYYKLLFFITKLPDDPNYCHFSTL